MRTLTTSSTATGTEKAEEKLFRLRADKFPL